MKKTAKARAIKENCKLWSLDSAKRYGKMHCFFVRRIGANKLQVGHEFFDDGFTPTVYISRAVSVKACREAIRRNGGKKNFSRKRPYDL